MIQAYTTLSKHINAESASNVFSKTLRERDLTHAKILKNMQ